MSKKFNRNISNSLTLKLNNRKTYNLYSKISGNCIKNFLNNFIKVLLLAVIQNINQLKLCKLRKSKINYNLQKNKRYKGKKKQLSDYVDFNKLDVDPAPFQLVENSSLYKVHFLFSLLGLNRAYVTNCGKLVGVVALKEVNNFLINF